MPDRLRHALGVALLLAVAAASGSAAWLQWQDLRQSLDAHASRLLAGPGMFYGFIAACLLTLLAGLIVYADLFGRNLSPRAARALPPGFAVAVAALIAVPIVGHALLDDRLGRAGYHPCGPTSWHRFTRTEWAASSAPCSPGKVPDGL